MLIYGLPLLACIAHAWPGLNKRQIPGFFGTQGPPPNTQIAAAQQQQLALARLNAVQVSDNVYRVQPVDQSAAYSSALIVLMPRGQSIGNVAASVAQIGQGIPGLMSANANAVQGQAVAAQTPASAPLTVAPTLPGAPVTPGTTAQAVPVPGPSAASAVVPSSPLPIPGTSTVSATTGSPPKAIAPNSTANSSTAGAPGADTTVMPVTVPSSPWNSGNLTSSAPVMNQTTTTQTPSIVPQAVSSGNQSTPSVTTPSNAASVSPKLVQRSEQDFAVKELAVTESSGEQSKSDDHTKAHELENVAKGRARGSKKIQEALVEATRSLELD